jgi:hypothetical protein
MKHKLYLLVALTLIAFVAITSYTPKAAQAEMSMQENPVSETEEVPHTVKGEILEASDSIISSDVDDVDFLEEYPSKTNADDQINMLSYSFFNAVGINFVPHDSNLTYYNGAHGCLGSNYNGSTPKIFSIPVNVPHRVQGGKMYFTYYNNIENPGGEIKVTLWRRNFSSLETVAVVEWNLQKKSQGTQYSYLSINDVTFYTSGWLYWFEFELPAGAANREFCGIQIEYENPPFFPLALPMINK